MDDQFIIKWIGSDIRRVPLNHDPRYNIRGWGVTRNEIIRFWGITDSLSFEKKYKFQIMKDEWVTSFMEIYWGESFDRDSFDWETFDYKRDNLIKDTDINSDVFPKWIFNKQNQWKRHYKEIPINQNLMNNLIQDLIYKILMS